MKSQKRRLAPTIKDFSNTEAFQSTPVLHKFRQISGLGGVFQGSENMQHVVFGGCIGAH